MPSERNVFGVGGSGNMQAATGGATSSGGALSDGGSGDTDSAGGEGGEATEAGGLGGVGGTGLGGANPGAGASGSSGAGGFDPEAGLVAHFTFDEASGASAANAKDPNQSAKCVGTCTRPSGQIGLSFGIRNSTSPSDWIELPAGILGGHAATTLSIWLRDMSSSRQVAPLFHFSSGADNAIYLLPDDRNPQTSAAAAHLVGVYGGTSFLDLWSGSTPALTDKVWHQVALSWSSASISLYVDGRQVATQASPTVSPSQLGATSPNYLGRLPDDSALALFAEIDDLRVYDRALSSADMALLYKLR